MVSLILGPILVASAGIRKAPSFSLPLLSLYTVSLSLSLALCNAMPIYAIACSVGMLAKCRQPQCALKMDPCGTDPQLTI